MSTVDRIARNIDLKRGVQDLLHDRMELGKAKKSEKAPSLKPPKQWWGKMVKRMKAQYPKKSAEAIDKIVGGIWQNYDEKSRKKVREAEGKKYGPAPASANKSRGPGGHIPDKTGPHGRGKGPGGGKGDCSGLRKAKDNKTFFSAEERRKLTEKKQAMPDGSFPIRNVQDLKDAIKSIGRAKNPAKVKAWIKKRAKALGKEDILPENW